MSADCQQITKCDRKNTLSADRFGWLQAVLIGGIRPKRRQPSGHGPTPAAELDREDGSACSVVEVVPEELGGEPAVATAATTRATRGSSHYRPSCNSVVPCAVSRPVRHPGKQLAA